MLVHGFGSNACTWRTLAGRISADGRVRAASLSWRNSYGIQADALRQALSANAPAGTPFILIGHSQGGMISRLAAQRGPSQVRGILTIGAPNRGAPFARDWWIFGVTLAIASREVVPRFGPYLSSALGTSVTLTKMAQCIPLLGLTGSMCDANPDGTTVGGINSPTNPAIVGAAVVHHAGNDRLFYRMAGDFFCDGCGSSALSAVTSVYRTAVACTVVSGIFSILWPPLLDTALSCAAAWGAIDALDWAWQKSVSNGDTSDGFIPVTSQQWPNTSTTTISYTESKQYRIANGATHAGELKDDRTRLQVNRALLEVFP